MVAAGPSDFASEASFDLSLVCSTLGRPEDLARMITSLSMASRSARVQLVVVDQSTDQLAKPIVADLGSDLSSWHYLTSPRGASTGRNAGLPLASAQLVGFPDDDCTYTPGLIDEVVDFFDRRRDIDGLCVRAVTQAEGQDILRYPASPCAVTRGNVIRTGMEYGIFLRRTVLDTCGGFDESHCVGSRTVWQSGEATDYLLRALQAGYRLWYEPSLIVLHPKKSQTADRARAYGRGLGHVLREHRYGPLYPAWLACRRAAKVALLAARGRLGEAREAGAWARGLLTGYLDRPTEPSS